MQSTVVALSAFLLVLPAMGAQGCICTRQYKPVCGNDGQTYSNPCVLNCAKIEGTSNRGADLVVAYSGPCQQLAGAALPLPLASACMCHREYAPVCGTDGETYSNDCVLNCAKATGTSTKRSELAIAHQGSCGMRFVSDEVAVPKVSRACICTMIYLPVCGTDGRTYSSACSLNCARSEGNSNKGSELAVAYRGKCGQPFDVRINNDDVARVVRPRPCICPLLLAPVCGTDGRTYDNDCSLRCARRENTSSRGLDLAVAHRGEC